MAAAEFLGFRAPDLQTAIDNYIRAKFGRYDDNDQYIEPDIEVIRPWAIEQINRLAAEQEDAIDSLISGHVARAVMLNTEIVTYFQAGRPANPQANIYVIADAITTRRQNNDPGITLHDTLESLFSRWRMVQSRIAVIITELDSAVEAINTAATIGEVVIILANLAWS